jgi:hypothetical protein
LLPLLWVCLLLHLLLTLPQLLHRLPRLLQPPPLRQQKRFTIRNITKLQRKRSRCTSNRSTNRAESSGCQKHHKKAAKPAVEQKAQAAKKHHKKATKPAVEQKAQAAKKHHKKATKPAVEQKAQAAKKHHKKAVKHEAAKPAAQPAA